MAITSFTATVSSNANFASDPRQHSAPHAATGPMPPSEVASWTWAATATSGEIAFTLTSEPPVGARAVYVIDGVTRLLAAEPEQGGVYTATEGITAGEAQGIQLAWANSAGTGPLGTAQTVTSAAEGGGGEVSPLTAILSDGWSATYPDVSALNPMEPVSVQRLGFNAAGEAVTRSDTLTITKRVRLPWATGGVVTLSEDRVALSDYVYAGDTLAGATNHSEVAALAPLARWADRDRKVVGNTLTLELVATSRHVVDGEPVACVVFSATDGTNTVRQTVSASVVSGRAGDKAAVQVYRADIDISTLAAGHIRADAAVFPHFGTIMQVHDSALANVTNGLRTQHFVKNVAKAAAPPIAVVATGGTSGGTVSTDPAVARAAPFDTVASAGAALAAATALTGGLLDGCEIWIANDHDTTTSLNTSRACAIGALTIRKDPAVSGEVVLTAAFGATRLGTTASAIAGVDGTMVVYKDLTIRRSAVTSMSNASVNTTVAFEDCVLDNNGQTTAMVGTNCLGTIWLGCTFAGMAGSAGAGGTTGGNILVRGCGGTANGIRIEMPAGFGNAVEAMASVEHHASRSYENALVMFNRFLKIPGGSIFWKATPGSVGAAFVGNLLEWIGTANVAALRPSGDDETQSTVGVIIRAITIAGADEIGRINAFYDEGLTARTHKLVTFEGICINTRAASKGDWFEEDGTRQGNWPYTFGVGSRYNFVGSLTGFPKEYNGVGSVVAPSQAAPISPKWVNPQHVAGGVAGAGGGDYRLQADSPARTIAGKRVLKFDLDGNLRPATNDAAGCYAAAA